MQMARIRFSVWPCRQCALGGRVELTFSANYDVCGVMSHKQVLARHQSTVVLCKRGRDKWATNPENPSNNYKDTEQSHQVDPGGGAVPPTRVLR